MIEDCRDTDTSCLSEEGETQEMCKFHQEKFAAWGM